MYLHIGQSKIVNTNDILGIFDMDNATIMKSSRDYLNAAEKMGELESVSSDLPKSFIVITKNSARKVCLSPLSSETLSKRTKLRYDDYISDFRR